MRNTERQRHRQREKQAPHGEPNAGLDPRTPGSCPEPKTDIQSLSHPGIPFKAFYNPIMLILFAGRKKAYIHIYIYSQTQTQPDTKKSGLYFW